jgi:hypothetical protein
MSYNRMRHAAELFCDTSIGMRALDTSKRPAGRWVFVPDTESDRPKPKRGQRLQRGDGLSSDSSAPSEEPQARARERPDFVKYDDTGRVIRLQMGDVLFVDDRHSQDVL